MIRGVHRLSRGGFVFAALALLIAGQAAVGQGRGGGPIIFTARRPPREMVGNIRGWANSNRTSSYNEDTDSHVWRVNFMAFFNRAPNAAEVVLNWFHIDANRQRVYVSNEPIALNNPSDRIFFHQASLRRAQGQFEPMEHYEAILSVNDARGQQTLATGSIQLIGQLERRNGVVDFTGSAPTAN
jgi:hypothetical protein